MIGLFLFFVAVVICLKVARWMSPLNSTVSRFRHTDMQSGKVALRCGCIFEAGAQPKPCKAHEIMAELV